MFCCRDVVQFVIVAPSPRTGRARCGFVYFAVAMRVRSNLLFIGARTAIPPRIPADGTERRGRRSLQWMLKRAIRESPLQTWCGFVCFVVALQTTAIKNRL